jgi:hypothetical protein
LKKRNQEWECKSPSIENGVSHVGRPSIPTYSEKFSEKSIRRELNLQQDATKKQQNTLEEDLKKRDIVPFAEFSVKTSIYSVSPTVTMYVDETDFGYKTGHLSCEMFNADETQAQQMNKDLQKVLDDFGLHVPVHVNEPIAEYIKLKYPQRYQV